MGDVSELFRLRKVNANTQALGAQARLKITSLTNALSSLEDLVRKSHNEQAMCVRMSNALCC